MRIDNLENNAICLIEDALTRSEHSVVAFSGGKDSTVVLNLVRKIVPTIAARFCNTGVESPSTIEFCNQIPNLIELKPEKSFWRCVDEYGFPQVKSRAKSHGNRCCYYLKELPALTHDKQAKVDLVFTGLTAAESNQRKLTLMRTGPYYQVKSGQWRCHPIWNWTEDDVWNYIHAKNLPYNRIYDEGAKRCGCQPCTAYINWKRNLARENSKLLTHILKLQGQSQLEQWECTGFG